MAWFCRCGVLRQGLRWLNTALRAVSGNSRESACFKLDKKTSRRKKVMVHRRRFLKIYSIKFCDIWQNFFFYRILIDENCKIEVEQTNFVTHLTITEQLCYWLNPSVKILSNKFPVVMTNYRRKSNERLLCKLSKSEILRLYSLVHVAMETTRTSNFTWRSKYFVSIFFTCQVQLMSCNLSLAMIWQITYTHKLPKLCSEPP